MPATRPSDDPDPSLRLLPSSPFVSGALARLPDALTSLIDREQELNAVVTLLRSNDVRLLTLTGPGDVGKTRLATAAATEVIDDFAHGVAFLSLAQISDHSMVLPTIARSFGLRDIDDESLYDRLIEILADSHLLLVLDNFEQVVASGPRLHSFLRDCPGIAWLITSRVRLRLSGEREFPVTPLPLPVPTHPLSLESSEANAALSLFVEHPGGQTRVCPHRGRPPAGDRDRAPGRWSPLGNRTRGRPSQGLATSCASATAGTATATAERWRTRSTPPPANDARHDRLELRPADPSGAGPLPPSRGLRWGIHLGSSGSDQHRRDGRPRWAPAVSLA